MFCIVYYFVILPTGDKNCGPTSTARTPCVHYSLVFLQLMT